MNIKAIRDSRNLTQIDLAEMTSLSQATISRAEKGSDGTTLEVFKAIADALGVKLWDLFADDRSTVEEELLAAFRRLPPARQAGWLDIAKTVAAEQTPEQSTNAKVDRQS